MKTSQSVFHPERVALKGQQCSLHVSLPFLKPSFLLVAMLQSLLFTPTTLFLTNVALLVTCYSYPEYHGDPAEETFPH